MNGGDRVAEVLQSYGVRFLFTLCGGHISPILAGAEARGIRVVDVRHEVNAVFAADAVARLTGVPGVAAVTAGPGLTNTITAVKNAQMAQSPLVILGGATATLLKGRGSLQDIDQLALMRPHVKAMLACKTVRSLAPAVDEAMRLSLEGIPGPVFVECPVDLLYGQDLIRQWYADATPRGKSISARAQRTYIQYHLDRVFKGADEPAPAPRPPAVEDAPSDAVQKAIAALKAAQRPVLIVGSGAMLEPPAVQALADAVAGIGAPVYLTGMARGLLGAHSGVQLRHNRRKALKEADVVVVAGNPFDFRLDYGRQISSKATLIAVNRSAEDLRKNRKPDVAVHADPGRFLRQVAAGLGGPSPAWAAWLEGRRAADAKRDAEIAQQGDAETEFVNPLAICQAVERSLADDSILVADGGDFVATASYIVKPRGPLSWLDPGVFGTLGVGAGFALGAKLVRPDAEVWVIWGDGSFGYGLAEYDTFARHGVAVIGVIGTDASWMQIARDQVDLLGSSVGTDLVRTAYHRAAEGLGAVGIEIREPGQIEAAVAEAKAAAAGGKPVVLNVQIGRTDFRKGSLSI
ncbi:MAG: thiamine pyrophosphate-binding protein [bacterium]